MGFLAACCEAQGSNDLENRAATIRSTGGRSPRDHARVNDSSSGPRIRKVSPPGTISALEKKTCEGKRSVLQFRRSALRLPSMERSGCFPVVGANGEPVDSLAADLVSEPRSLRHVDGATRGDFNLRLDDVLIPVAAAGGNVAGQRK